MVKSGVFVMLWLVSASVLAAYGPYQASVVRVVDGDTVELRVQLWPGLEQGIKLRLDDVNTPEKRRPASDCERAAGRLATQFTKAWLAGVKTVTIYDVREGKYAGRMLGRLRKSEEGLAEALLAAGLARPYDGKKRLPWC